MTKRILPVLCVGVLIAATSSVFADDVKLKNGKVLTDVNVIKETKTYYKFRQLNGDVIRYNKDAVLEVIKKPTFWDEFKKRKKTLKKKDATGLFQLAVWAKQNGLKKDWRPTLKLVLKINKNHEEANRAMGNVLLEGKWVSAKDAQRLRQRALEADYKARGWKRKGGKFVSPAEFSRHEGGWVEHDGHWVDKKLFARIRSNKLKWFEGRWVGPKSLKKMRSGLRLLENRWLPIEDLNDMHSSMENPWVIRFNQVEIRGTSYHPKVVLAAKIANSVYKELIHVFGEEADTYGKNGPLRIYLNKSGETYNEFSKSLPQTDWESYNSSSFGAWFSSQHAKGGAGVTYYHDEEYLRAWIGYTTAMAYLARLTHSGQLETSLAIALASYGASFHGGKFAPAAAFFGRYLRAVKYIDNPQNAASGYLDGLVFLSASTIENRIARAGLLMHFYQQKNPDAFAKQVSRFLSGSGTAESLVKECRGATKDEELDREFRVFARDFSINYKPWKIEDGD